MAAIPRVLSAKLTVTLHWQDPRSSTLTWAECRIPDIDDFRWWFFTQKRLLVLHCQRYDDAHMEMAQDVTHRGPVQHLNATLRLAGWQSDVHQFNQAGPFTISRYLYQVLLIPPNHLHGFRAHQPHLSCIGAMLCSRGKPLLRLRPLVDLYLRKS